MKTTYKFLITLLLISTLAQAQPRKGEFINAALGLGISVADYQNEDIGGSGFYVQAEYVHAIASWLGIRPYAGLILTSPDKTVNQGNKPNYTATSKAFLVGGKARFCAPIPYVAPYFETGLGVSIGAFETYTPVTHIKKNGVIPHIPVAIGLAIGKKHSVEVAFTYYLHPSIDQFSGAAALGFTFPL